MRIQHIAHAPAAHLGLHGIEPLLNDLLIYFLGNALNSGRSKISGLVLCRHARFVVQYSAEPLPVLRDSEEARRRNVVYRSSFIGIDIFLFSLAEQFNPEGGSSVLDSSPLVKWPPTRGGLSSNTRQIASAGL